MKKATIFNSTMKFKIDENEADTYNKVKKFGTTITENTKRAALGDLQNRVVIRNVEGKEVPLKDLKAQAKARVDSHWKKLPISANNSTVNSNNNINNGITQNKSIQIESNKVEIISVAAAAAQRKPVGLTRANSMRVGCTNKSSNNGVVDLPLASSTLLNKPKTLTTKVIENKPQPHKLCVLKTKTNKEEKPIISVPTLRREDSNLSRKSLSKLKAALARDAAAATKTTKVNIVAPLVVPKDSKIALPTNSTRKLVPKKLEEVEVVCVEIQPPKHLTDVEDIDADDADNLVLVSQYVNDIYNYLYSLEIEHSVREDYLVNHKEIFPKMRAVLVDWINEVHAQFHCVAETFQMAVAIIDRYLQMVTDTKRSHLQLVGVTALFIASKYEELFPPAINDFVYITDETYSAKQILQMEKKIMKVIDFNLSRPLPLHFLRRYSKAASAEDIHHAMSKYFLELVLIEYDMAHYKPSEVAASSIFLSLHLINGDSQLPSGFDDTHWTPTLEWYSRYPAEHLHPIAKKIAALARNAATAKLKSVYTKYQSQGLLKVSMRPELTSPLMDSIINSED